MVLLQGYASNDKPSSSRTGSEDLESDSESDDGDFENHDLQDITDIANGNQHITSSGTKKSQIDLHILKDDGRRHTDEIRKVSGRFDPQFLHPFWMVSVEVKEDHSRYFANCSPSYRPREDNGVNRDVYSLFLKSCGVHPQHCKLFLEFIQVNGLRFSLKGMQSNLTAFSKTSPTNEEIADQIQAHLHGSVQGKALLSWEFTQYIHRLFPRRASKLLEGQPVGILCELSKAVLEEPWVFGYRAIMRNKFKILGCEAKIKALKDCNLYEQMSKEMKDALSIYHNAMCMFHTYGHTFIPFADLEHKTGDVQHWDQALEFLRREKVLDTEETEQFGWILFLPQMKHYEDTIAESIASIMEETPWISKLELNEQPFGDDEDQIKAAHLIAKFPVVVMSGKGGCGKTHVVSEVLKGNPTEEPEQEDTRECPEDLKISAKPRTEMECSILLTAPTGKAASILGKRTNIPAYTLHHVICSFFQHYKKLKDNSGDPSKTEADLPWKFASVRMLVCDECSLVSVKTFSTLIDILRRHTMLTQLVLLGDVNQLPSIEPGNFLGDVYEALKPRGVSITLTRNHRTESELIVQNAECISKQELPKFDQQRGFEAILYDSRSTVDAEGLAITEAVKTILKEKKLAQEESQFISFRKRDCLNINELCSRHYNKHSLKDLKGRADFQVGDKVCIGRNRVCFDYFDKEEVRLCNGEIFIIKEDVTEQDNKSMVRYLKLDDGERQLKVEFRELKKSRMKHAWAKTIHTYQGSETDTVVYVIGRSWYENWQHVYTAVTRGRSRVFIICNQVDLWKAVKSKPTKRFTRLKEFLEEKLPTAATQSNNNSPTTTQSNRRRESENQIESPGKRANLVTAKYQSTCAVCGQLIQPGVDQIIRSDVTQTWIHRSCDDTSIPQSPARCARNSSLRSSPSFPPKTSTPVKAAPTACSQLGTGNERKHSTSPGSYCRSSMPSPFKESSSTPKEPEHQPLSYSHQSPATPRISPSKRQGEPENHIESPVKRSKGTTANFDGTCGACGIRIRAGDQITPRRGVARKWVHLSCDHRT